MPIKAPALCTERVSPESKSTWKSHPNSTKIRGNNAEKQVKEFLVSRGFKFVRQGWKTPYAEVDLIFRDRDRVLIVEVKTLTNMDFLSMRVHPRQLHRLRRAQQYILDLWQVDVELVLAFVSPEGRIFLFNDE